MATVRGLCTLDDARKSIFGNTHTTAPTTLDADIEAYISAATPVIEEVTGPMYAESRTVVFNGGGSVLLLPFRFNSVTSVTVDSAAYTTFVAEPTVGAIYAGTSSSPDVFADGVQNITVVVTVGYATIPPNVVLAARELVRLWWQNGRQANRPDAEPDMADLTPGVRRRVSELLNPTQAVPGFA